MVSPHSRHSLSLGEVFLVGLAVAFPLGPRFATSVGNIYLATVAALVWLGGWLVFAFAGARGGLALATAPQKAVAAYAGFLVLQVLLHLGPLLEEPASLFRSVQFVASLGLFVCVSSLRVSPLFSSRLLRVCLVIAAIECAIAWLPDTKSFEGFMSGTFDKEHNSFAAYVLIMLCVALAAVFSRPRGRSRIALAALVVLAVVGLALSFSRSVYIAAPIALLAVVHRRWNLRRAGVAFGVIVVIFVAGAYVSPAGVRDRAGSIVELATGQGSDISFSSRLLLWREGFASLAQTGMIGVGPFATRYIDSYFVRALVETGPVGLILYVLVLVTVLAWLWRRYEREEDRDARALVLGLYGATAGLLLVMNLTMDTLIVHRVMGVYWILLGSLVASKRRPSVPHPLAQAGGRPASRL